MIGRFGHLHYEYARFTRRGDCSLCSIIRCESTRYLAGVCLNVLPHHTTLNDQHMFAIEIADTNVAIEALHTNQLLAAERHPHLADLFQYHSTEFERSVVEFQ